MTIGREEPKAAWKRRATAVGLSLALILALAWAFFRLPADPLFQVREDAKTAIRVLDKGDLLALDRTLASNRGETDFAYFFTSETSPRQLGDALATVADRDGPSKLKKTIDRHAYDLALTDLAGTLALATHGTGDRALPASWTDNFIEATTTPQAHGGDTPDAEKARVHQDLANRQNLLLLLSRGYWSADFLKAVTTAYWAFDRHEGKAWPGTSFKDAKYAPAPNGSYLTDGILALTAALTANPAASAWAFTDFQPGSADIAGTAYKIGKFTHYLLFEHQFPEADDGNSVGMTAVVTALASAIGATGGASETQTAVFMKSPSAESGPLHDSTVLQTLAKDLTENSKCSWSPGTYWNCAKQIVEAVWHWLKRWGHLVLDILSAVSIAALFAVLGPEVITGAVVISGTAAAVNAAWYAIDGDYAAAGLSFAAIAAGPIFKALARATKAGVDAVKAARYADEVANAAKASSRGAKAADELARAEAGAAKVVRGTQRFTSEGEFEKAFAKELKGSTTQRPFRDPACTTTCRTNWREGDVFHAKSGALFELKVGKLNKAYMPGEIAKDLELRASQSSGVKVVKYIFAADKYGKVFPDDDVRLWLKEADIPYFICQGKVSACVKAAMAAA
jgi:hypothetical protein